MSDGGPDVALVRPSRVLQNGSGVTEEVSMAKKEIRGWTVEDWDGQYDPTVTGPEDKWQRAIDLDTKQGEVGFERFAPHDGYMICWVPLEVVAEVLRLAGYRVTKGEQP